jgi:hypothetical protein
MAEVEVTNVEIWRCPNSKALEDDIGHPDIAASLITALKVSVPLHNKDHDEFPTSMASHLKRTNLGHMMTNEKCFMTLEYISSHNAPPTDEGKLIIENKLGIYELGASCKLTVKGGGYSDGQPGFPANVTEFTRGTIVRHLEFIFDTRRRYV